MFSLGSWWPRLGAKTRALPPDLLAVLIYFFKKATSSLLIL